MCNCNTVSDNSLPRANANTEIQDCTYSLEFLRSIVDTAPANLKPYVQSQINVYNTNCNLFVSLIQKNANF